MKRPATPTLRWGLLAGLAGAVLALGQAPFDIPAVALAGLAMGIWTVAQTRTAKQSAVVAWSLGFGYFLVCLHWIVEPFLVDPVRHGWMAPFALVLLPGGLALFWGCAGALSAMWRSPALRALGFGSALALLEIARGYILTGFPWTLIGTLWLDTPAAQSARVLGVHGLGAVTLLALSAAVAIWTARQGAARALALAPLLTTVAALVVYGQSLPPAPAAPPDAPTLRLVQPNAAQHLKWDPEFVRAFYDRKLDLTAGSGAPADLVIWPETAISQPLSTADRVLAEISQFAGGAPVILGANRWRPEGPANALVVVGDDGAISALYDKAHLVPFGEYVPFGDLAARIGIRGLAAREGGGFAPGPGPVLLDLGPLGRVLPLICYEAIFPQFGRTLAAEADWMVQITNDAWFGRFAGPQQHLAIARIRAIERGMPLVRVANTGISAIIDARGTVLNALPLNEAGALDAALPPKLGATPHVRWGDAPATVLLIVLFLSLLLLRRRNSD